MSDFFTVLAARARSTTSPIRPRLPSRFEAPQAFGAALEETVEEERDVAPVGPPERFVPKRRSELAEDGRSAPAGVPLTTNAPPPAEEAPLLTGAEATLPEWPQPVEARNATPHDAQPNAVAPAAQPSDVDPAVRRSVPGVPPQPSSDADRAPDAASPPFAVQPARAGRPAVAALTAPAIASRRRRNVPAPAVSAVEETNVHITIGRLEVRAAPAAAAPRRDAPASAVMPLGEYLRSQSERRRT